MAASTGTIVISQAGSSFDSATYPRFVLGDGSNTLTFVIDNDARGLIDTEGNDAISADYTSPNVTYPLEDPQKGRLVVPTFDEADGAKKALLSFWITDEGKFDDILFLDAAPGGTLSAITARLHFVLRDADGNEIKIGGGDASASELSAASHTLIAKYGSSGSPRFWLYKNDNAAEYFIRLVSSGSNDWKALASVMGAIKHAYLNNLINIDVKGVKSDGTLMTLSSVANDTYTASETQCLHLEYETAGFKGNACSIELKDPNTHLNTSDKKKVFSYGYDEYLATDTNVFYWNRHSSSPTDDQFLGENLATKIYFRQGTIAGSGSDASLSTTNIAEAIKDMVNGSILGITASRSGSTVNLTNDTDGDVGNVTITTTNEGSLFSVTGMSNAGGGGGSGGGSTAMRMTISAKQLALSSSGGIAAFTGSSDQPSLKMDIAGLAALGASPASGDFIPVHDVTTAGSVKRITVAELIGSVAAGSDTQVQFNDGGSSLGGDSGLTYNKTTDTLSVGNDLKLTSDSAILSLGAGDDATLTHDGTTGLTIAATPISIDSTGELHLNSTTGDIKFQDGGTDQLALDLDGTSGEIIMQLKVDSDDFVFKQYDGTEVFRVEDDGSFDIAGGAGSSGVTVSAAGQLTVDGRVIVDDATDATSTTDGSLQTDGGLSVVKDIIAGNDVKLLSDSAVLAMGAGSDVTLTHDGGTGATLASAGAFLIDGANAVSIDGASGVNIGTNDSGAAISIGHTTSEVTVNDNLTVTGDLTVNGTTTTIDTTNLLVEDPIVLLNKNNSSANGQGGIAIENGGSSADMVFGRVANDTWGVGTKDTSAGSVTTLADMTLGAFRAGKLEIDGANDYIDVDTDLKLVAAADIVLDPAGSDVKVDGNVVPNADDGGTLGSADLNWSDLYIADAGVLYFGDDQDVSLTHVADTGLLLSSSDQLQFGDNGTYIHQSADGVLDLVSDSEIEINATTIDMNGAIDASSTITAAGRIIVDDATEATSTTDGSLQTDGGLSVAKSAVIGDDLDLLSDAAIVNFGADKDVTLTHVADTGLLLNSSRQLQFGDSATHIKQVADGQLELEADTSIQVDAPIVDFEDDGVILQFGAGDDVTLTHVHDTGLLLNSSRQLQFGDSGTYIHQSADGVLDLVADTEIEINATTIDMNGDVDMSAGLTVAGASVTFSALADLDNSSVASGDKFVIQDADASGVAKEITFNHVAEKMAGAGIANTSGVLSIAHHQDTFVSGGGTAGHAGRIFTMTATPASADAVSVYINGLLQARSGSYTANGFNGERDYNISGTTLTLVSSNALSSGDELVVRFIKD